MKVTTPAPRQASAIRVKVLKPTALSMQIARMFHGTFRATKIGAAASRVFVPVRKFPVFYVQVRPDSQRETI